MKLISIIAVVILLGCGSQLHEQAGSAQNARGLREITQIIKRSINGWEETLAFLRTHPFATTIGIRSNTIAEALDIHPIPWGQLVNSDSSLVTHPIIVDGKVERYIFAKRFTPAKQVASYLRSLDPELLKKGIPIEEVGAKVDFKQEGWSRESFHGSIGNYLDKDKYVSRRIMVDGKEEMYIFAEGFTPAKQIASYLRSLDPELLKKGIPIEEVGAKVTFKHDGWSREGFHMSIGRSLDKDKYVSRRIMVDGKGERYIFAKRFTPAKQVASYLRSLDPELLKKGIPIEEVGAKVDFKQEGWSRESFHGSIGNYLDKDKYVSRQIRVDGKGEMYIFAE